MHQYSTLYLASGSPRRQEILTQLGVDYIQVANHFDETRLENETPKEYVERVTKGKALSAVDGGDCPQEFPILSADTTVVHQGEPLGKPRDLAHASQLLTRLSGQKHQVLSSVVIVSGDELWQSTVETDVVFAKLSASTIESYCRTEEPLGKAGGYAIQGLGGSLIESIKGSYTNVVGLPIFETRQLLEQANIRYALT